MIISVDTVKNLIDFAGWTDEKIERKLKAIEQTIRKYTNNNFQKRAYRKTADIVSGLFYVDEPELFKVGDTVQVSESELNGGLFTVASVSEDNFTVEEEYTVDEENVLVTKIEYPDDVVDCAVNLLEWEVKNRSKVGVKSESKTLSRHSESVTYEDSASMFMGYPKGILSGLCLHKKARF